MSESVAKVDPTNPRDVLSASGLMLAQGDVDGADQMVRWALDFNPSNAGLLTRVGEIAARRGESERAIAWTEQAVFSQPGEMHPRHRLFSLHLNRGDLAAAERVAQDAIAIAPNEVAFMRYLGDIASRRGDFEEAQFWAERATGANTGRFKQLQPARQYRFGPRGSTSG